ncbi:MAG: hypothetical protein ACKOTH_09090 [Solirubrobacterales bacterium]
MARKSLKPQLNQIRMWVRQGRTDAWIAHQLEVPVGQVEGFKKEFDLDEEAGAENGSSGFESEVDLRAEDEALVAARLEEEEAAAAERRALGEEVEEVEDAEEEAEDEGGSRRSRRSRRGRRGGRRRTGGRELEGTFDHGEEGYGLWLDPSIADDPVYAEHWAGQRAVTVKVEADRIVIRRAD